MKPDWDKLMSEYDGHATKLIGDVDCTSEDGEELCDKMGVEGFPTIKWGAPDDLQEYEGGREFEELKEFAEENLKPMCSVKNLDLCDDEKKAEIKKFQDLSDDMLNALIEAAEKKIEEAEEKFESELEKLQERYSEMEEEKERAISAVKKEGLSLMRSVRAAKESTGNDEL